jgi:hypothetical protein
MNSKNGESGEFTLQHDARGRLVLVDAQGQPHAGVEPVRGFPISDPDHWISICDADGRELVSVKDLAVLSPTVREFLERDLARREFVPTIHRVVGVPADTEPTEWEVDTDRGRTRFLLNSADDVRRLGPNRVLVIDTQGIRYLIEDVRRLDATSRRILERYV